MTENNRQAARRYRERQRQEREAADTVVRSLSMKNEELKSLMASIQLKISTLKEYMAETPSLVSTQALLDDQQVDKRNPRHFSDLIEEDASIETASKRLNSFNELLSELKKTWTQNDYRQSDNLASDLKFPVGLMNAPECSQNLYADLDMEVTPFIGSDTFDALLAEIKESSNRSEYVQKNFTDISDTKHKTKIIKDIDFSLPILDEILKKY